MLRPGFCALKRASEGELRTKTGDYGRKAGREIKICEFV